MTWVEARKKSGLASFERNSKRKTKFGGRMMLAWKVPGTQEAGRHNMLEMAAERLMAQKSNPGRGRSVTLRNMALVTIKRERNGAVRITGRRMPGRE